MTQLELFVTANTMVSHGTPPEPRSRCFNCDWTGRTGDAIYAGSFVSNDRIADGEPIPSGRCPKCDCYVYEGEAT